MAKKKKVSTTRPGSRPAEDKPATLKDLLHPDVVEKLKAQADEQKEAEAREREEKRKKAEEARKAEQKRLDNDFEHLLNNTKMDWRNFKS